MFRESRLALIHSETGLVTSCPQMQWTRSQYPSSRYQSGSTGLGAA